MHFDIGQRVRHGYLGLGVVEGKLNDFTCLVRFDQQPPDKYNGGKNPCPVYYSHLDMVAPILHDTSSPIEAGAGGEDATEN